MMDVDQDVLMTSHDKKKLLLLEDMINLISRVDDDGYSQMWLSEPRRLLTESVKEYLEKGADADGMPGAHMLRPLHAAAKNGQPGVVQILVDAGAYVNYSDAANNRAPLHYASEICVECVHILVKNGAFINIRDGDRNTPLHWAAYRKKPDIVKYLLENGAIINAVNVNNDHPLNFAAMRGSVECCRILLDWGADVTVRNAAGKTPLIKSAITHYGDVLDDYTEDETFNLMMRASGISVIKQPAHLDGRRAMHRDLYRFLHAISSNAAPLASLCRAVIRQQLVNKYLPDAIRQLHLPKEIERYLLLRKSD